MMRTLSVRADLLIVVAALAAAIPTTLRAQPAAERPRRSPPPVAAAARLQGAISVDGRLDEAAWRQATPVTDFRQFQPDEGEPASLPMELRILFDDGALYIGARMTQPGGVAAPLARRDQLLDASGDNGSFNSLTTDKLVVNLDPYHNRIDNAWFEVNPAGVKGDQFNGDPSWDPIWDAAAQSDAEGWTAEMRIPYSQLRFSRDKAQVWGMQVWRYIDARNEQDMWSFWRRNASGGPAFFGEIAGLEIGSRPRQVELLPYVVAGGTFEDAATGDPYHDGRESNLGVGADIKYLLTSNLTLDATLNPDFGQVEVDPASLNLSAYETYYEEKRPFFIAGASAFRFGGMRCMFCSNTSGLSAFYSRRIGRPPQLGGLVQGTSAYADAPENTTILGAAKVTGRTQGGYTIGVLDALSSEETARFLRGSGAPEASQVVEPLSNYFVGRVKKDFNKGSTQIGGIFTSMVRSTGDSLVNSRLHGQAEAAGLDWRHFWKSQDYSWMGSMMVSSVAGSPEVIARTQRSSAHYFQRPDRTTRGDGLFGARLAPTATSLRGYGLFSRVGKDGGTFVWEAVGSVRSPGFEVNDLSFLNRTDFV
ncbi:MAG: carbohydrate binding family 9 domain-containing protein, partial [Gemmatimonadetes bacterium]|nr:carbohydrate binding family 9 domain-containing protein [Gemmatimonadota bacterium]